MSDLIIRNNPLFGDVRFVNIEGKPYVVAKDVASALGYKDTTNAIKQHCKGVVKHHLPHPQNKNKTLEINVIPEGDIYRLIIRSKLPQAEKFERWVFDEVLPQIRQTGGYIPIREDETDAEIMAKALLIAQKTIEKKDKLILELEPKAEIYDRFVDKEATWGFRELRKELESALGFTIKESDFKEVLRDKKWIGKTLKALSYAIRNQYMVTKDIEDKFGNIRTQDRFTLKAKEELLEYYKTDYIS